MGRRLELVRTCNHFTQQVVIAAGRDSDMNSYPVFISIADPWQVVAGRLVQIVKLLRRLETPSLPLC